MAYLEITLKVEDHNRAQAAEVYNRYKEPFLKNITGARSKELLVRGEDVQVLHGFDTIENAKAYTESALFQADVVGALKPLLAAAPDIRFYQTA
jgi:muconolactone delta-isomerase